MIVGFPNTTEVHASPGGPIERATVQYLAGAAFPMLGVKAALGRVLHEGDDPPLGAHPYAVLGYDYWQRRFWGDLGVLGRKIQHNASIFEVIGVARKGFFGTDVGKVIDVWLPTSMADREADTNPSFHWFHIMGHRDQSVSREALAAAL